MTAPSRRIVIIGAPTAIGISPHREGRPRDLHLAPRVLREEGVVRRLRAADAGDVTTGDPYRDLARPARRMRNGKEVARCSLCLARRVEDVVAKGALPLVLGGDCSILLGCLLGLRRRRGAVGLVYVDAHADFASLDESASRSACSMSLALATGRVREPELAAAGGLPLDPRHVAHLGRRDEDDPAYGSAALRRSAIADLPTRTIRERGAASAAAEVLARATAAPGGFWVHLDVDVLDPELMPAVDSPLAGGLDVEELQALVGPIVRHPAAAGVQLTIYDPTADPDRSGARLLVDLLDGLVGGGHGEPCTVEANW